MPYVVLTVGLVLFVFLVRQLAIVRKVREAGTDTRDAIAVIQADGIDERSKETLIQSAAGRMGIAFIDILVRSAVALLAPSALFYLGTTVNLYSTDEALAAAGNPYALLFFAALTLAAWRIMR
ncbi:MAG: hypothetical protein WD407_00590 [Rhodospirillales bacterium]